MMPIQLLRVQSWHALLVALLVLDRSGIVVRTQGSGSTRDNTIFASPRRRTKACVLVMIPHIIRGT